MRTYIVALLPIIAILIGIGVNLIANSHRRPAP